LAKTQGDGILTDGIIGIFPDLIDEGFKTKVEDLFYA